MLRLLTEKLLFSSCGTCRSLSIRTCVYSQELENKYSELEKGTILQIINEGDTKTLSRYNITKSKQKIIIDWRTKNGKVKTLRDIESIDGFTEKYASKLCSNIVAGPQPKADHTKKIKGQVLNPAMTETVRKNCQTVLAVYVTVNSVCWTLVEKSSYKVIEWKYKPIEYPSSKGIKITDILNIAWRIAEELPSADVYAMKAEATSLRASGGDPNNPKMVGVNLQKAQIIAMLVAFINARTNGFSKLDQADGNDVEAKKQFQHKVYFLRPTLPFRLYGTLVGKERVSTDQTVETLLQQSEERTRDNTKVFIPDNLKTMFRSQRDLQKDMLGHCLLLAITFMDVCVFMNKESIDKLIKRGE